MKRKDLIDWDIDDHIEVYEEMLENGADMNNPSDMVKFLNKILRD